MGPYDQYWIICWGPVGQLTICDSPEIATCPTGVLLRFELPIDTTITVDFSSLVNEHGQVIRSGPLEGSMTLYLGDTLRISYTLGVYP